MGLFSKRKENDKSSEDKEYINGLIEEIDKLYDVNNIYDLKSSGYLPGNSELELHINRLLELKNTQVREQFLLNSDLIEFITQMDYVKDMIDNVAIQGGSMDNVASSSEAMSKNVEEMAQYVSDSLVSTTDAISISKESIKNINSSFDYINSSFEGINDVQDKMKNVVETTREIDNVVNIINEVAEKTNLLSLNASIEAARAGESGRGFAVVANEIKKLADNTKKSAGYIKDMVNRLRGEINISEEAMTEAGNTFSIGKEQINNAAASLDTMNNSLQNVNAVFENISANIEEQSATTEEINAKISELHEQTKILIDACMKTGKGLYTISYMAEHTTNAAIKAFKDYKGNQMLRVVAARHLAWRWKAYNAVWGFVKLKESSIGDHRECNLGVILERLKEADPANPMLKMYEPHEKVHELSRLVIEAVNKGDRSNINEYLKELDGASKELYKHLKYFYSK